MKNQIIVFLALMTFAVSFSACTKPGLGGEASILAFPKHHDDPIPDATIYIKYDAKEFPGTDVSVYDDAEVASVHPGEDPHAHFTNLEKGSYYLYGVGFDSSINQIVTGGIPVEITEKSGELEIVVPVTE